MPGGRRRVLYVGTLPPHPGGSAIWGRGLLPKLAGLGHPIIAMAPIPDGAIVDDAGPGAAGIEVRRYRVPYFDIDPFSSSDRSFYDTQRQRIIDQVAPVLASGWPEVILIGNAGLISGIPELGRRQGIPTIAVVHTAHWFDGSAPTGAHLSRPRMLELLGACDRVVGVAHHVAAALARLDLAHLSAIPNAVDLEVFRPGSRPDALAARHRIPCDAPVVSHLSNLKPIKEAWRLLRAAPMILDRHPRAVFLVMGDGPGREELARLRQELGLARHVHMLGWIDHARLPEYYDLTDVVALTSVSEGAPFVFLEALASGCGVVSTPIEAARELLGGVPGTVIAASHEPAAIAGAVCDLLDQVRDRRIRGEIAQAAAARFDLAEAARQFSELLDSVRPSVTAAGRRTPAPGGR